MLALPVLLQVFMELVFALLGFFLVWLAYFHRALPGPTPVAWAIVSAAMILLGLRALVRPGAWKVRWQNLVRGLSLVLVGVLLLGILRVPFGWVDPVLEAAGLLLMLRGLLSAFLILRLR
jgi:hypothetical protein